MANKVLALTTDGRITFCEAPEDQRGKGRCPHIAHQENGETVDQFTKRVNDLMEKSIKEKEEAKEEEVIEDNPISFEEVQELKKEIISIITSELKDVKPEDITAENLLEYVQQLDPVNQQKIVELGFESAKYFAFPVTNEQYEEEEFKTDIYFSNQFKYKLGAKESHINEILGEIGEIVKEKGGGRIDNNYLKGLTNDEYWDLQYATRIASINKTVSVAAPGYCARTLYYGLSDTILIEDCLDDNSEGILSCHAPGGVCEKCMRKSGAGKIIDVLKGKGRVNDVHIGGLVSTNLSEPITQAYLNAIHAANDPHANDHKIVVNTFDVYKSSPIIMAAMKETTTEGRRKALSDGLKAAYKGQGIDIDDWNIELAVKKMTSYKKNPSTGRYELLEDGELCDIMSAKSMGNRNNMFKKASLGSSYKLLSKGGTYTENPLDSFSDLMIGTE